jgi:hypothetical protein
MLQKLASGSSYVFPFFVKTTSRTFELYTTTPDEREMWISGFKYILISTKEVQQIISANDEEISAKMRKQAKRLRSEEMAARTKI